MLFQFRQLNFDGFKYFPYGSKDRQERFYFAGEIIDLDAETGGYNFQIAWPTGWKAVN